ncbi:MAG: GtrA family protein, partial [Clostridia bacterium]|nr:GtrA family protein [Clostridia bacterium]
MSSAQKNTAPQKLTAKQNLWQSVKFVLFSASAGIIQVVIFTLLNELAKLPYWPAYLTALLASVIYNFTVNRRYTFRSDANVPVAMAKLLLYYAVFTPLSTIGGDWLTGIGWNEYLVLAITMITNFVTEFLVSRFWLYRNSIDTNELAK